MSTPYKKLSEEDAFLLLIDHQAGLISLVPDFSPDDFKNNLLTLADVGKFFNIPTLLTTSFDQGPNGPVVPELKEHFPDAPFISRPGQINAWNNEDFVADVKATGRNQLIMAGVVADVRVAFPALSAIGEGYDVFVVTDTSGIQPRIWWEFRLPTFDGKPIAGVPNDEDCGGLHGYEHLEHFTQTGEDIVGDDPEGLRAWLGGWTPEAFDNEAVKESFDQ